MTENTSGTTIVVDALLSGGLEDTSGGQAITIHNLDGTPTP